MPARRRSCETTGTGTTPVTHPKSLLLPALLAAGTGIGVAPAVALELGELNIDSTLGQPLRASVAYALAPNEQLAEYCIAMVPAPEYGGVPAAGSARISVANGILRLTGSRVLREPVVSVKLSLDCPYSPRLERVYTAFLDPAIPQTAVATKAVRDVPPPQNAALPARRPEPAPAAASAVAAQIAAGVRYTVRSGDSLSAIAGRIENRQVSVWAAVGAIHRANPDAFTDGNPDRLKAGVSLLIPAVVSAEPVRLANERSAAAPTGATEWATATSNDATAADTESLSVGAALPHAAGTAGLAETGGPIAPEAASLAEARPGDIIVGGQAIAGSDAEPAVSEIILLDERVEQTAQSPNRPVARIVPASGRGQASDSSLWWMVGGGFLLLGGLLYAGLRTRGATAPEALDAEPPLRRASDFGETEPPVLEPIVADDYALNDDSPTAENFVLDANLEIGTGLGSGDNDLLVAEDFGFDTSSDLDLELPDDSLTAEEEPSTDVIPAPKIEETMIVECEILPEDGDYDISVIMDVTKVPDHSAVTERDLKAVIIDDAAPEPVESHYTVSQEVDYQILDEDHEDPLTATQALNLEIEKATAELANSLDEEIRAEARAADQTPDAPVAVFVPRIAAVNDDDAGDLDTTAAHRLGDTTISEVPTARLRALRDERS
jgi:hypothetical protein